MRGVTAHVRQALSRDYSDFSEKLKFKDVTHPGVQIEISFGRRGEEGRGPGEGRGEGRVASIAGYPVDCYIDISLLAGEPFHWRNKIVESAAMCIKVMDY